MSRPEFMGDFHGATIDFAKELVEARKMAGLVTTDLDDLHSATVMLYLNCPEALEVHYQSFLAELVRRMEYHGQIMGGAQ